MSRKLIAVAGALAMVVLTPAVAEAKARPNTYRFTGGTNPSTLNVNCVKGQPYGKSSTVVQVKATRKFSKDVTGDFIGNSLGQSTKFIAEYPGGKTTLGRFETNYKINQNKKFSFPCPLTVEGGTSQFPITIQPYRGSKKIGTPAKVNIILRRVGSSS